jgi:hypothetical protein
VRGLIRPRCAMLLDAAAVDAAASEAAEVDE